MNQVAVEQFLQRLASEPALIRNELSEIGEGGRMCFCAYGLLLAEYARQHGLVYAWDRELQFPLRAFSMIDGFHKAKVWFGVSDKWVLYLTVINDRSSDETRVEAVRRFIKRSLSSHLRKTRHD